MVRPDPLNVYCGTCLKEVGHLIYPERDETYTLKVECHGETLKLPIPDIAAFREETHDQRGPDGHWYVVFQSAPVVPNSDPIKPTDLGPMKLDREQATQLGFTGNMCNACGGMQMVRNGTCEKCTVCGETTGCS